MTDERQREERGAGHLRRLLVFVSPYRWRAAGALALLTALVGLDLALPRLVQRIIDQGIGGHDQGVVVETGLVMLAISLLGAALAVSNNVLSIQVGEGVARDVREAIFIKIQSLSFGDLDRRRTGELMVRLTSDVAAFKALIQVSLRIGTRAPLLMIGSLVLMVRTSQGLALTLLPLLAVTAVAILLFVSRMEPLFRAVQQRLDRLNTILQENIAGARLVRSFCRADHETARFEDANQAYAQGATGVVRFMAAMVPTLTVFVNVGVVLVVWAGGLRAVSGDLTTGQIVAFVNYLLTTMTPLILMAMLSNLWAAGVVSARRIDEVLRVEPEVGDPREPVELEVPIEGRIAFEGVGFHFPGGAGAPVLEGIDLVIEPGQTVAFLGATGSGKSTLVSLVPRLYDATSGRVTIDGVDVRRLRQADLIAQIGLVPQETLLFSGTVREAIRFGAPEAGDDAVEAAARAAEAHEFIEAMPEGYGSRLEPRGASLSGGQRQRLTIARALVPDPRILILDDATSSVDVETEARIQAALRAWPGRRTTLIVAQRISTVLDADLIVVLDRGRIVAKGTHRDLMLSSPEYREIYDSQLGDGDRAELGAPEALP